ncbi:phosphodiesterase-nucleotide pyrophosphatase [Lysobacter antibioticus]|uniref:alkaline phosphatase family protein n=1 Tax=Lysobacter antibioticus TaxID=84531 RepID=UPI0007172D58|nr:ectonucleotide pyrophosphatase/phosphodiesterase [Lysobacter antibioticus]ALN61856.1 phosphodiesterase-nucleotide pyrophosphatase [Lysobacter antibioticus]
MRPILSAAASALLVLVLAACAPPTRVAPPADTPLLLISIDGFRASYFELGLTPHIERFAGEGVRAQWMTPSYPSLTFPNHYTLVTGLRPDHHGVVHNSMSDEQLGRFKISDRDAVGETRWWNGGEPIWIGAQKAGLRSATLFWPGSEAPIRGLRPNRWRPFDAAIDENARVDEVLAWLGEPASTRPHVATLYFDALDREGHDHGPNSPQVREALARIDIAMGRLLEGLSARKQLDHVNIVLVSDHGMAEVAPGQRIAVEDMVSPEQAVVTSLGQSIGIIPNRGHEAEVEQRLLGPHVTYDCWRKAELPEHWHYGSHPRVPPIVCQMHEGWDAIEREKLPKDGLGQTRGSHGFDPALPSMRAIFVARGPAFKPGTTIPAIDNVDVYPLLARLIGIPAAHNDGEIAPLLPALREP